MADTLIKTQTRPEVFAVLADGKRHFIPDPPTLTSRWSWADVKTVPDAQLYAYAMGDPIQSVATGQKWPDNALVYAASGPEVYVIRGGQRHWIPDPATFNADGFDWGDIETIDPARMAAIPLGPPLPAVAVSPFDSGQVDLGAGHFMRTWGTVAHGSGAVAAMTRIFTVTAFGGFHGGATLIAADANDAPVWRSANHRYGVDGRWIGQSDRTEPWFETVPPGDVPRIAKIYIFQAWEPDSFMTILNKWAAAAKPLSDLVTDVAAVAKVIVAAFA